MKINFKQVIIHALLWIAFIALHFQIMPKPEVYHENPDELIPHGAMPSPVSLVVVFLSLIGFYYFNTFYLIPSLLAKRMRLRYTVFVLLFIPFMLVLVSLPHFIQTGHLNLPFGFYINTLLLFAIVFIVSSLGNIITRWFTSENNKKEIEHQKTLAELSFLKAQINPHFLFNTLNNIYLLALKKSEQTPEAIIKLSSMMRYVLNEAKEETVDLDKEIAYIGKYIDLQKMRFTDAVTIDYIVSGYYHQLHIAPLILIPYIENAFKFGVSTHSESRILVSISVDNKKLILRTSNQIFNKDNLMVESNGIGLVNAKRRLDLFYANKYLLKINEDKKMYEVNLELQLD